MSDSLSVRRAVAELADQITSFSVSVFLLVLQISLPVARAANDVQLPRATFVTEFELYDLKNRLHTRGELEREESGSPVLLRYRVPCQQRLCARVRSPG